MSLIKKLLLEAPEDITVPAEATSAAPVPPSAGMPMTDDNFSALQQGQPGMENQLPSIPNMPTANIGQTNNIIQKTIINKELVLNPLNNIKAVVSQAEKKFSNDDMTLESTQIYIASFLDSISNFANELKKVAQISSEEEGTPEEAAIEQQPELSQEQAPEAIAPSEEEFTEPVEETRPVSTNPTEAIG